MASSRWHQDIEVAQLIEHLNHPDRFENPNALTAAEGALVLKELDRCRKDFIYAARNYFWITTKREGDKLFSLWPGQELILQKILEIKSKGQPQKILIIKGRQLGCSTLIEALVAWSTMFFSGRNALVVSYDRDHTTDVLFPIMQFIYDRTPWWLQPQTAGRKAEGMFFENPDPRSRGRNPGLNSRIYVKGANSTTGVGQGIRLNAVHASEAADWEDHTAKEIIAEDMTNALVESPDTFAIIETTAKGANRYIHKLWKKCVERAEEAEWYPLFLPAFFEDSRVRVVMPGFRLEPIEIRLRERVLNEWVRCDNPLCKQYHYRFLRGEDRSGTVCVTCHVGIVTSYTLTDQQLNWLQHRRKTAETDEDSTKKLAQELCMTAEDAFQVSGYQIFGQKAQEFANSTVREPIAFGDFDKAGDLHCCNTIAKKTSGNHGEFFPCLQAACNLDHTFDANPLRIWEMPMPGFEYSVGADVAEGLGGSAAYSVGCVIRVSQTGGGDFQVATWRSNQTGPINFAAQLSHLGRFYNEALMAVECNKYDIVIGQLRYQHNYVNMYRWKHLDSININSAKLGWWTNLSSRPRLWQTFKSWLQQELFHVRSHNLAEEMKNFTKDDEEDTYASGDRDSYDDELFAAMISLYTAHETDYNDNLGLIMPKAELTMDNAPFKLTCLNCGHSWPANRIDDMDSGTFAPVQKTEASGAKTVAAAAGMVCPVCKSRAISINRNQGGRKTAPTMEEDLWNQATTGWSPEAEWDKVGKRSINYDDHI